MYHSAQAVRQLPRIPANVIVIASIPKVPRLSIIFLLLPTSTPSKNSKIHIKEVMRWLILFKRCFLTKYPTSMPQSINPITVNILINF